MNKKLKSSITKVTISFVVAILLLFVFRYFFPDRTASVVDLFVGLLILQWLNK